MSHYFDEHSKFGFPSDELPGPELHGPGGGGVTHTRTPIRPTTDEFPSQILCTWFSSRWRGVGDSNIPNQPFGIFFTTTCGTHLWSWRRVIYPTPQCPKCNMFVLWSDLNGFHPVTEICSRGKEFKFQRLVTDKARVVDETDFTTNGHPLMVLYSFNYIGRLL